MAKAKVMVKENETYHQRNSDQDLIHQQRADRINITFYTDPLCCWSWAIEPQWRKLQYEFRDMITVRYCLGGMLADWNNFNDTVNSISRPIQMGPLWAEARHISGMPFTDRIWIKDPPATSYTTCVAIKCAGLQSTIAEEKFLRYCREAIMIEGINVARQKFLFQVAERLSGGIEGFDLARFKTDYSTGAGTEAFKSDLKEVRYKRIQRFPSLVLSGPAKSIIISGYRPYEVLRQSLDEVAGKSLTPSPINEEDFIAFFGTLTEREIQEAVN